MTWGSPRCQYKSPGCVALHNVIYVFWTTTNRINDIVTTHYIQHKSINRPAANIPKMAAPNAQNEVVKDLQVLSAAYQSPTNEAFTTTHDITAPPTDAPADRATYLSSLRKATITLQEQINTELTARMEEDKARGVETAKAKGVDEAKEEDTYGEEVPEEE